ncbi:MAG TPA: DUF1572 family protein [Hanamia sp.]|nr:DUF1572 family protein [Hanamia sp.]
MNNFLESSKKQFSLYRSLGEKTIERLNEEQLLWQFNEQSNSIAIIVQHLYGNMLSRWTHFLNEDGEKEWRDRNAEFEKTKLTKKEVVTKWNAGWDCLFAALYSLNNEDLDKIIYIRKEPLSVMDAITRQLAHYSSHVGQIVYVGKMLLNNRWVSLSIPKKETRK